MITVAELLEMPHLRLRLLSGRDGLEREVSWTHTCDLPEPWQWLTGGELLLTNGMSFPKAAREQEELVSRLVDAGASALAIGEQMYCPPLTARFTRASDALALPVLSVEYPMPFVAISREVAAANLPQQSDRLMRTERIYHALQRSVTEKRQPTQLATALSQLLGCELHVCHRESAEPWFPGSPEPDAGLREALSRAEPGSRQVSAGAFVTRMSDGRELRLVDIPTQASAVLALVCDGRNVLDAVLMQHAATVIALEMSQALVDLEHRRRQGAEFLARLMDGSAEPRSAHSRLREAGIDPTSAILYAVSSDDSARLRELHVDLWRNGVPHLVVHRSGALYLLAPDEERVLRVIRSNIGPSASVGLSAAIKTVERIPEAAREAHWASRSAERIGKRTFRYGEATPFIGVASIEDAIALVDRLLGRLLEYESSHRGELLPTLESFFDNQRSWQKTADALHVHRQTVLYRIRKVEDITGLSLDRTRDIAELWLALQARSMLPSAAEPNV
ncbi:PucR family transcriptional regulator [Streptomyces antnestii]|uniref:PucR family transcriptional regulator n=1 Tax=Streptomyces antnestii TaxID=2494256 RepID=A0A437PN51_9ACTN|nr:PucR family transcriptional regulator [Streptomyces sp. San01]RVU23736.1 PucR family transcriptional regulator [Streptomyces sp. San01]